MNYNVYSKVNVADLPVIDTKTINNLFRDLLKQEIYDYKLLGGFKSDISVTEINDNDVLLINIVFITGDTSFNDSTERLLRRITSSTINKFCENELESVVFDIVSLEVTNAV